MNDPLLRPMRGQIVTRIRDKILCGDYAPGSALLQDSIAAEFGVSKIPVREALVRLRAEGLIDIEAHRGFRVRPLLASEVDEVFRLRLALEPGAVALQWTAAETDLECLVLRRTDGSLRRALGPWGVRGAYTFVDTEVEAGTDYEYCVRVRDRVGHGVDGPLLNVTAI